MDLTATGYVIPQITAKVGAKVIGRVTRAKVREGQSVKAGEVLFDLDAADQAAAVASARARVAAASAKVLTVKAQRAEVDADFKRQKQLAESGAATRALVEDLERKLASLDAQIKAAEAAGEDVAAVRSRLAKEYTYNVASPFLAAERGELDGVIEPSATRVAVIKALRALRTKRAAQPAKKHGNIPL